jgi:hypothetical protein
MLVINTSLLFIYIEYRTKFCNKETVAPNSDVKFDITSRNNETNIFFKKGKPYNLKATAYLKMNTENINNFYSFYAFINDVAFILNPDNDDSL